MTYHIKSQLSQYNITRHITQRKYQARHTTQFIKHWSCKSHVRRAPASKQQIAYYHLTVYDTSVLTILRYTTAGSYIWPIAEQEGRCRSKMALSNISMFKGFLGRLTSGPSGGSQPPAEHSPSSNIQQTARVWTSWCKRYVKTILRMHVRACVLVL